MTMILASSQNSEAQPDEHRKVNCRIIRSIEFTHSASRNTTQPVVSGKFEGEVNILSTRLAGLDRIRLKYSHLEADFLALKRS